MRTNVRRRFLASLTALLSGSACGAAIATSGPAATNASLAHLRAGIAAYEENNFGRAESEIQAAVDDPVFGELDEGARHTAYGTGADAASRKGEYAKAHVWAALATTMPQQTIDDWRIRTLTSIRVEDVRDEVLALTELARRYGRAESVLDPLVIRRVVADASVDEFAAAQFELFAALGAANWRIEPGGDDGRILRDYARMLIERDDMMRAIQVAAAVANPYDVIGLRADARFRPILKTGVVHPDPLKSYESGLESLRRNVREHPRKLEAAVKLAENLLITGRDAEVLSLTHDIDEGISGAGRSAPPYEDAAEKFSSVLDARSQALVHSGRFDEAVEELRRAVKLTVRDKLTRPLHLGTLLADLNRPDEALAALPAANDANLSPAGRAKVAVAHMAVALLLGDQSTVEQTLALLRAQRERYAYLLQEALARAGADAEAEDFLIWRLNNATQRTNALVQIQSYRPATRPPRALEWQNRLNALRDRPRVIAAAKQVGRIDRYLWLNDFRDY